MAIESIWLDRGMCFGSCPIYRVTFEVSGRAVWRGEGFTERIGHFIGEISDDDFISLVRYVERSKFFEWADEYVPDDFITDHPTFRIGVTGDLTKEVSQYATDEPPAFGRIAKRMDAIADVIVWHPSDADGSAG